MAEMPKEPAQQCRVYGFLSLSVISLALTLYQMSANDTSLVPEFHRHVWKTPREDTTIPSTNSSKLPEENDHHYDTCNFNTSHIKGIPRPDQGCIDNKEKSLRILKKKMASTVTMGQYSRYKKSKNRSDVPFKLYKMAPKIFDEAPDRFLGRFKNPCWNHRKDLYCLPYFYVIGMPKCGSSDLFQKLTSHEQVIPGERKEPAFWNKFRYLQKPKDFSVYMENFLIFRGRLQGDNYSSARLVTAEGTVASMWSTFDVQFLDNGVKYGLPDILNVIQPKAKFFIILRDPIDRLSSDYHYFGDFKRSPEDLHQKVLMAINEFNKCKRRQKDYLACIGIERSWAKECIARVSLGIYSVLLRQWFKVFPLDNFFVIKLSRWESDCPGVMRRAYNFLELDPLPDDVLNKTCSKGKALTGKRTKMTMMNETRRILECFYKSYNDDLEQFLSSQQIDQRNL